MFRQIIFTSLLTIGSAIALVNPATAQFDAETIRVLQLAKQGGYLSSPLNQIPVRNAIIEQQNNQNYQNLLYQACQRGNRPACNQYQSLSNIRIQQYNNSIQGVRNYSNYKRYGW